MKATTLAKRGFYVPSTVRIPLGSLLLALLAFFLWHLASLATFTVASPLDTLIVLYSGFSQGWIVPHIQYTFTSVGISFGLAIIVGFGGGVFLGTNSYWRAVFEEVIMGLYAAPKITIYPIFILLFGFGTSSQGTIGATAALFPLLVNTMTGLRQINPVFIKVGRSLNASPLQLITKVYLPAIALPVVAGLRICYSISVVMIIMAELIATRKGLGLLVRDAYNLVQFPRMYAVIFLLLAIALVGNLFFWVIERKLRGVMT